MKMGFLHTEGFLEHLHIPYCSMLFPSSLDIMNVFQRHFSFPVMAVEYSSVLWHHLLQKAFLILAPLTF